jgi:23S rRNA pseudouridine1911/1915/1917 synthase
MKKKESNSLSVIIEEPEFVVVNKPIGILVHPSLHHPEKEITLVDLLRKKYPEINTIGDEPKLRPGIVHRLDRDTSGVLVVARTQGFFSYMKELLQKRIARKTYIALVHGFMERKNGIIDIPIGLKPGTTKRSVRARNMKMVKPAVTEYKTLEQFEYDGQKFSLLELFPRTGRTHQLRVHLSSVNHSVVGDQMYGRRENPWGLSRQFLHADSIEFDLPSGKRIRASADLPDDLVKILKKLRK